MLVAREKSRTGYLGERRPRGKYVPAADLNPVIKRHGRTSPSVGAKAVFLRDSLHLVALLFFLMAIGVGLISQHGRIVACNYRIHQLQREKALLQEEKENLCIEVQRLASLERIEKIALNELGLQYPDKKQWLVLSMPVNGN